MSKQFTTVRELVNSDLRQKLDLGVSIKTISSEKIDLYFQDLILTKGHLSPIPLKLGTVNRYVEKFVKNNTNE